MADGQTLPRTLVSATSVPSPGRATDPTWLLSKVGQPGRAGLLAVGLFIVLMLAWQVVARLSAGGGAGLPGPLDAAIAARELLADPFYDFGPNDKGVGLQLLHSLRRLLFSYVTAAAVAVAAGVILGLYPLLFQAVNPFIQVLKTVSPLAWMPLFLYTVRDAERAVFLVVVMSTLWPILTNSAFGVSTIDRDCLNVASILQLPWHRKLYRVVLPAAAPSVVVGLRIAIGSAWIALVAAEMLVGGTGIGYFVWNEWNNLALTSVIVGILLIGGVGFLLDACLGALLNVVSYKR